MARINVNPTRMELTKLKKRLTTARRGHKMLKDKRDELMRQFLDLVRENRTLRAKVEKSLTDANKNFEMASASMNPEMLEQSLLLSKQTVEVDYNLKNIMSVNVPDFSFEFGTDSLSDIYPYGLAMTSGELDDAIFNVSEILPDLLKLATVEKSVLLLSYEIEKTRRRVNALEYNLIPQLEETIKFITMKLDENERGSLSRLMKVKDMMLEKAGYGDTHE